MIYLDKAVAFHEVLRKYTIYIVNAYFMIYLDKARAFHEVLRKYTN
jgi:hypothetical protein